MILQLAEVVEGIKANITPFQNWKSVVENKLYYSYEKKQYLVVIRIFNEGTMVNAYLDIFNEDMSHHDEYQYDVWAYTNWVVIE